MIEIRSCEGMEELDACVQLELDTWGYDATEVVPRKTFLLAQKIGGQVLAAFDGKILVGFAMSLPGVKSVDGKVTPYLHSHMLAVRPKYRDRGIGAQLKLQQRCEALNRGIRHMEWTFDPLEIKNAYLNIHRLGAVCRSYRANFYGVSSSRLQGGLPTDRLLAEWELDSARVFAILEGHPRELPRVEMRIMVPASVGQWKATGQNLEHASALQSQNRAQFEEAFTRKLSVIGFERDEQGNGIYELGSLQLQ